MNFQEANKIVHKVETQWHYPVLIAAGFEAITQEAIGFVRNYEYRKGDRVIVCTTGSACDYWNEQGVNKGGYHGDLASYLNKE